MDLYFNVYIFRMCTHYIGNRFNRFFNNSVLTFTVNFKPFQYCVELVLDLNKSAILSSRAYEWIYRAYSRGTEPEGSTSLLYHIAFVVTFEHSTSLIRASPTQTFVFGKRNYFKLHIRFTFLPLCE
jgi:hypothetical protein